MGVTETTGSYLLSTNIRGTPSNSLRRSPASPGTQTSTSLEAHHRQTRSQGCRQLTLTYQVYDVQSPDDSSRSRPYLCEIYEFLRCTYPVRVVGSGAGFKEEVGSVTTRFTGDYLQTRDPLDTVPVSRPHAGGRNPKTRTPDPSFRRN